MAFITRLFSGVLLKVVTALVNWAVSSLVRFIESKQDDKRIDDAFGKTDRTAAARELNDVFRGV